MTATPDRIRAVVAIGEAADDVAAAFAPALAASGAPIVRAASMAEAVDVAGAAARPGDVVVLSPGCASFDWYRRLRGPRRRLPPARRRLRPRHAARPDALAGAGRSEGHRPRDDVTAAQADPTGGVTAPSSSADRRRAVPRPPAGRGPGAGHRQRRADPGRGPRAPTSGSRRCATSPALGHARRPGADRLLRPRRGGRDVRHARPRDGAVGVGAGRGGQRQPVRRLQPPAMWAALGVVGLVIVLRVNLVWLRRLLRAAARARRARHARPVRAGPRRDAQAGPGRGSPSATSPCSRRSSSSSPS